MTAAVGGLTAVERARLAKLEAVIERSVRSFIDTGRALLEVREGRLYREEFGTFDDYCRLRWGFGRSYAYEIMQAVEAVEAVSGIPDVPVPRNAGVAAELAPLADDPDEMRDTWQQAVAEHGPAPTAKQVKEIRQARNPEPPRGDPERDTRFEILEDAVELLQLLPAPERCVFPESGGDVESLNEAVAWLADWLPRFAREWRAHKVALRQRQRAA